MSSRDVTGRWEGIFNYPRELPPNGFVAVLIERAGAINGETEEVSDVDRDRGARLAAVLTGARVGSSVCFDKRYETGRRAGLVVRYAGTLAPEGDEIVGEWTIPGVWSGSFIMVRQSGPAAVVEETAGAEAR